MLSMTTQMSTMLLVAPTGETHTDHGLHCRVSTCVKQHDLMRLWQHGAVRSMQCKAAFSTLTWNTDQGRTIWLQEQLIHSQCSLLMVSKHPWSCCYSGCYCLFSCWLVVVLQELSVLPPTQQQLPPL